MLVKNLEFFKNSHMARVQASVSWEDCDQPERIIYLETDKAFADSMSPNPNAFLLGAILPGMKRGERRIRVEGTVCPELRNGLITAMHLLQSWYGDRGLQVVSIEATDGFKPTTPLSRARTGSFLSGGVDALSTLRTNRLDFPIDHPASIKDGLFVHGLDIGGYEELPSNRENSQTAIEALSNFGHSNNLTLIPVYTNWRYIDPNDDGFFYSYYFGAMLGSIAHIFSPRLSTAIIASGVEVSELAPCGSHPLLDPLYSSADLKIQHDGIRHSRLEKVQIISQWDSGLQSLRACFNALRPSNALNCGKCENA